MCKIVCKIFIVLVLSYTPGVDVIVHVVSPHSPTLHLNPQRKVLFSRGFSATNKLFSLLHGPTPILKILQERKNCCKTFSNC